MPQDAAHWWPKPEAGDIVWCHFPHLPSLDPGPKPRPALIVRVKESDGQQPGYRVFVAYGTSQKTAALRRGEFLLRNDQSSAFQLSGLSFDTKFSFANAVELNYSSDWFKVSTGQANAQTPKIGILHSVYAKAAYAAYIAIYP
jgi:hypothetical protein